MRALLLAAALLPSPACAGDQASRAVPALGVLGAQVERAMPGLSPANLYVPGFAPLTAVQAADLKLPASAAPYPAAWNPARAAVLLERAKAEGAMPAAPEAAEAKPLLEKINAVLTDFTPQELAEMPAEELNGLIGVVMDQGGSFDALTERALPGAAALSRKRAALIKARLGAQPEMDQPYPNVLDGHEVPRYTRDAPAAARFLEAPYPVLRHYLSEDRLAKVAAQGVLGNAVLPYVQRTHGVWHDYYETLTGLFLTLPGVRADSVGVREHNASFVDVALSAAFPLLEIEPGRIYLVPMPGMPEKWVRDLYFKWIAGDRGALSYHGQLPRLEENGGPGPHLHVPVTVVGSSR